MKCPYCGSKLEFVDYYEGESFYKCPNNSCKYPTNIIQNGIWQDLINGKKAQSELNYYKGLNCPTVVEKQMQTITELSKQLTAAQKALETIHDILGLDKSDEELDKMMILPTGLHIIKQIVSQGLK